MNKLYLSFWLAAFPLLASIPRTAGAQDKRPLPTWKTTNTGPALAKMKFLDEENKQQEVYYDAWATSVLEDVGPWYKKVMEPRNKPGTYLLFAAKETKRENRTDGTTKLITYSTKLSPYVLVVTKTDRHVQRPGDDAFKAREMRWSELWANPGPVFIFSPPDGYAEDPVLAARTKKEEAALEEKKKSAAEADRLAKEKQRAEQEKKRLEREAEEKRILAEKETKDAAERAKLAQDPPLSDFEIMVVKSSMTAAEQAEFDKQYEETLSSKDIPSRNAAIIKIRERAKALAKDYVNKKKYGGDPESKELLKRLDPLEAAFLEKYAEKALENAESKLPKDKKTNTLENFRRLKAEAILDLAKGDSKKADHLMNTILRPWVTEVMEKYAEVLRRPGRHVIDPSDQLDDAARFANNPKWFDGVVGEKDPVDADKRPSLVNDPEGKGGTKDAMEEIKDETAKNNSKPGKDKTPPPAPENGADTPEGAKPAGWFSANSGTMLKSVQGAVLGGIFGGLWLGPWGIVGGAVLGFVLWFLMKKAGG